MVSSVASTSHGFINSQQSAKPNKSRQLQLRFGNQRLIKVWFAGVNPKEFTRVMKPQEVEQLSIPLLCDDIVRELKNAQKRKVLHTGSLFMELYHLMCGIILLYKTQTSMLYDQVVRQVQFSLEFVQERRASFTWEETRTVSSSKKKRSSKYNDDPNYLPRKRIRISVDATFDWREDLNDIEVDDESTIQMLQNSKVMNRNQICLRDAANEPTPTNDLYLQDDEFDATENVNTQNFNEIRDLVSRGHSIMHIIQNDDCDPLPTQDRMDIQENEWDEDRYQPITNHYDDERRDPLPDIETYQQELDMPQNVENEVNNFKMPDVPSRFDDPAQLSDDILDNLSIVTESTTKGTKRKRGHPFMDRVTQIPIDYEYNEKIDEEKMEDKKLYRFPTARLDCINDRDLLLRSRTRLFDRPTHMSKQLKPRHFKDTTSLMVGVQRAKRLKRKETTDQFLLNDFLNAISGQPQQDESVFGTVAQGLQPDVSPNMIVNRSQRSKRQPQRFQSPVNEPVFEHHDELMYVPEMELPPNLPSRVHVEPSEASHQLSYIDPNEYPTTYRHKPVALPSNVQQVLNKFVTITTDEQGSYGSQTMFVKKNQKNRKNWGLKGVLSHLLGLWKSNIHPLGMKELMQSNKQKLAAALAFYSIMELNSPRIGLILIEKYPNSNAVFHIKQSPKLINLLQKK